MKQKHTLIIAYICLTLQTSCYAMHFFDSAKEWWDTSHWWGAKGVVVGITGYVLLNEWRNRELKARILELQKDNNKVKHVLFGQTYTNNKSAFELNKLFTRKLNLTYQIDTSVNSKLAALEQRQNEKIKTIHDIMNCISNEFFGLSVATQVIPTRKYLGQRFKDKYRTVFQEKETAQNNGKKED